MRHEKFPVEDRGSRGSRDQQGRGTSKRARLALICEVRQGMRQWKLARLLDLSETGFRLAWLPDYDEAKPVRIRIPGIEMLTARGVTVRVLGLCDLDSTSATGRLMIGLLGLVAEFERSLIQARTISGIANARRAGVCIGRPPALDAQGTRTLVAMKSAGASVPEICMALSVSERTVRRVLADHAQRTLDAGRDSLETVTSD